MHNPFPGMNPYLEHPALWPDVHNSLMAAIRDAIVPKVAPNYYVGLESRAYIVSPEGDRFIGRPDIAVISPIGTLPSTQASDSSGVSVLEIELPVMDKINHYFLEVRAVQNHQLITAIELLSPVNKVDQRGRKTYLEKRQTYFASQTSLIEIDLLRAGKPLSMGEQIPTTAYRILVKRGWIHNRAQLYTFGIQSALPTISLPLTAQEEEPLLDLNQIFQSLFDRARFDLRLDYASAPVPPLAEEEAIWSAELLAT